MLIEQIQGTFNSIYQKKDNTLATDKHKRDF